MLKLNRTKVAGTVALICGLMIAAVPNRGSAQEQDIVDTAIGGGVFNTLVTVA